MTVIRVHELAKKMGVESKDLISVLDKIGIKGKTPSSGLDDKESKSLIEKLKAIRKEKEKIKKEKEAVDPLASKEERLKKAAALIGKFSSTLEKPGAKPKPAPIPPLPKPAMPAPPVIPPASQLKAAQAAVQEEKKKAAEAAPAPQSASTAERPQLAPGSLEQVRPVTSARPGPAFRPQPGQRPGGGQGRPAGRPFAKSTFGSPVLEASQVPASLAPPAPGKPAK